MLLFTKTNSLIVGDVFDVVAETNMTSCASNLLKYHT